MSISVFKKDDIPFAVSLTEEEGWFYTPREIENMLRLDPEGSFVFRDGEPLGFATTVTYGRTGVLGHLIVSKKGRGRKIGNSLVEVAVEYMEGRGVEAMLVLATQEGVRLYQKHGFTVRDEISCTHSKFDGKLRGASSPKCLPIAESDLNEVAEIDSDLFGDDRSRLIELLYREGPEHCYKIVRRGSIAGFIFARPDHVGFNLGPWVCLTGDPEDAETLFKTALSGLSEGILYSGSFTGNADAIRIVDTIPRKQGWRIPLMIRGKDRYRSSAKKVFGIAAFELG